MESSSSSSSCSSPSNASTNFSRRDFHFCSSDLVSDRDLEESSLLLKGEGEGDKISSDSVSIERFSFPVASDSGLFCCSSGLDLLLLSLSLLNREIDFEVFGGDGEKILGEKA